MSDMLHLKIPASTANLGVGFDSIGMALNKFLYLDVKRTTAMCGRLITSDQM